MGTKNRLIATIAAGVVAALLMVGPSAMGQATPVVGSECSQPGLRGTVAPFLECKETKVKGKKVLRWAKHVPKPPPKSVTGLGRCLWGDWAITGEAYTAYWASVIAAFANASDSPPADPGEVTEALADTSPLVFRGDIQVEFRAKDLSTRGSMTTDGIKVTGAARLPFKVVGKSQIKVDNRQGFGMWQVDIEGIPPTTETADDLEPITIDVACNAKTLTWTIPLEGTTPAKIVLVRPPSESGPSSVAANSQKLDKDRSTSKQYC